MLRSVHKNKQLLRGDSLCFFHRKTQKPTFQSGFSQSLPRPRPARRAPAQDMLFPSIVNFVVRRRNNFAGISLFVLADCEGESLESIEQVCFPFALVGHVCFLSEPRQQAGTKFASPVSFSKVETTSSGSSAKPRSCTSLRLLSKRHDKIEKRLFIPSLGQPGVSNKHSNNPRRCTRLRFMGKREI